MSPIEELIAVADRLCNNLDRASQNEKKFSVDLCMELERYSWEVHRMMEDIKCIKENYG